MTAGPPGTPEAWEWRCLHCGATLASGGLGLLCGDCDRAYPVIAGVPILVKDPIGYVRSELSSLVQAARDARMRRDKLDRIWRDAGLSAASIERHRDVLDTDIARAEMFRALLAPDIEALGAEVDESLGVRRSGWSPEALFPYLLRDWMNTAELAATGARITAALTEALPDPSGKPVVFAASGAAGLLAEIPPAFDCLMGFDLTLPVLAAARRLLDGNSVELALPRAIRETGRATLRGRPDRPARAPVTLVAMDALNTALADGSVACVVTSFLLDLIPEPRQLANEIHRILCNDGVWINYGPSGPLTAFWRFDAAEGAAFIEAAGFTVMKTEAHRATYLDVSDDCPMWSFRSHICYLTSARKAQQGSPRAHARTPGLAEVSALVPQHFAGAQLVQRHSLGPDGARTAVFRHDGIPGRARSLELDRDTVRIMALVDGMRTVDDIAALLGHDAPAPPREAILSAFARYFAEGLLDWRSR